MKRLTKILLVHWILDLYIMYPWIGYWDKMISELVETVIWASLYEIDNNVKQ